MTARLPSAPDTRDVPVRSAYAEFLAATAPREPGFPRAVKAREWVPGVVPGRSALAVVSAAALSDTWMPHTSDAPHLEQAVQALLTSAVIAVSTGFPAMTVWFGFQLVRP